MYAVCCVVCVVVLDLKCVQTNSPNYLLLPLLFLLFLLPLLPLLSQDIRQVMRVLIRGWERPTFDRLVAFWQEQEAKGAIDAAAAAAAGAGAEKPWPCGWPGLEAMLHGVSCYARPLSVLDLQGEGILIDLMRLLTTSALTGVTGDSATPRETLHAHGASHDVDDALLKRDLLHPAVSRMVAVLLGVMADWVRLYHIHLL